ncbi:penicillin-binding protein 2 [Erysipelotrichaceae bacterium 51-3]
MKKSSNRSRRAQSGRQKTVSNRILILALAIVSLFTILLARLVDIQAIQHTAYVEKQDDYTSIKQYTSAPRGQIYDSAGNVLAKTVPSHNIVYTAPNNATYEDSLIYADRIGAVFHMTKDDFSLSELKDAYLRTLSMLDPEDPAYNGMNLLSDEERAAYENGEITSSKVRALQLAAIDQDLIDQAQERSLIAAAIYDRMAENASTGQASVIKEDVDDDDASYLVEHKMEFPGFDVDFNGWKREYPYGQTLSDVLGSVSTSTEGLPENLVDEYLAKGFQYNAQVGKSGLEYEYNDILSGTSEIAKITYDSNGLARKEILQPAVKGHDIYLSINIELQQTLDSVLKDTLLRYGGTKNRENFYSLFMCMENPKTGDVLALSGYQMDPQTHQLSYYASGNYTSLVNPGSCVKGITVYMGLSEGVIQPGEVIVDEVINVGGQELGSFKNHGPVNEVEALSVSSNVYMFNIGMRLGGYNYVPGDALNIQDVPGTLDKMRQYYSMFGLGNQTGIDVPNEVSVYAAGNNTPGMVLNYVIGQLDTYSPLQLMQYAGVVAESGKMYQPRFYKYATEVNGDQIFDLSEVTLKSELPEENTQYLERVQEGFRACVADGNCGTPLETFEYNMAAKTGTAEVGDWTTANLIGYGPIENPTVAFACSAPTSSVNSQSVSGNICTTDVVPPVLEKYFELYPQDNLKHVAAQ